MEKSLIECPQYRRLNITECAEVLTVGFDMNGMLITRMNYYNNIICTQLQARTMQELIERIEQPVHV